jgi:hypothetical protein
MERIPTRRQNIMRTKMCRYKLPNGQECRHGATIDGLCITHYRIENGLDNTCKDIKKYDLTIHLWEIK